MHDSSLLLFELGAVILGLGLLGAVSVRFGFSPIPLYLLAGLAFGQGGLVPLATSDEFISAGAEIGVILLLFTLGLEYTASELVTTLRQSAPVGLVDLALNAAPGVAAGFLLGWGPIAAVVLGGVTYVTSSGITAKVISDLGWIGHGETPVVLSLLVLEDLAMVAYLPILAALLVGTGAVDAVVTLLVAAVVVSLVLVVSLRFGRRVEAFLHSPSEEVFLLKVFGTTLLVAGAAQYLQVSAAVGAFLVGVALSGPVARSAHTLITPLRDLFAAVFFVFFGLNTNPADLPPVAGIAAILAAAGILTKFTTGWLAARRAGIGPIGRARAGATLISRGEFNIVIAGLAVAASVHPDLGPLATAYVLVLAAIGPLAARVAEPLAHAVHHRRNST